MLFLISFSNEQVLFDAIAAGAGRLSLERDQRRRPGVRHENVAAGNSILDSAGTQRVLMRLKSGIPAGDASDTDKFDRLSPQERKVLALATEGTRNKQIGLALGLSDKTVKNYLSNAMDKLKPHRRSRAAAWFARHGPPASDQ